MPEGRLDDLGIVQEAVEVVQDEDRGPVGVCQGREGTEGGKRIASPRLWRRMVAVVGHAEPAGHVPHRDFPSLAVGVLDELAFRLVGLVGLYPEPGEGGVNVVRN